LTGKFFATNDTDVDANLSERALLIANESVPCLNIRAAGETGAIAISATIGEDRGKLPIAINR
jgi:hypothetical protein